MSVFSAGRASVAFVLLGIVACPLLRGQTLSSATPAVNQDSLVISTFESRVKEYMKLHNKAQAGVPATKPTASASEINQRRLLLADNIRAERPQAKRGDIFSTEITEVFERLIATAYQGKNAPRIQSSLRHDEPVSDVRMQVNAAYPETAPLQSTPPSILGNLPKLPPELDYRIVGRDLVLRDVGANLIVDYIPGAIPSSSRGSSAQ